MFPFDHQDDGIANLVNRSLKGSASRGRSGRLLMVGNNQAIARLTDIPRAAVVGQTISNPNHQRRPKKTSSDSLHTNPPDLATTLRRDPWP